LSSAKFFRSPLGLRGPSGLDIFLSLVIEAFQKNAGQPRSPGRRQLQNLLLKI
jgi:hypothetical protein